MDVRHRLVAENAILNAECGCNVMTFPVLSVFEGGEPC